jgi:hypothetical protein
MAICTASGSACAVRRFVHPRDVMACARRAERRPVSQAGEWLAAHGSVPRAGLTATRAHLIRMRDIMTWRRGHLRNARAATTPRPTPAGAVLAALLLAVSIAGACRPRIGAINATPNRYYGREVKLYGRIGEIVPPTGPLDPVVFHLVAEDGGRIIVVAPGPFIQGQGDWVRVRGQFTAEITVGGHTFYDVIVATRIKRARAPLLPRIL